MAERFRSELHRHNPVVVSLRGTLPFGEWHGFLLYAESQGDFLLISKTSPSPSITIERVLSQHLGTHEKVDCLFMTRLRDRLLC